MKNLFIFLSSPIFLRVLTFSTWCSFSRYLRLARVKTVIRRRISAASASYSARWKETWSEEPGRQSTSGLEVETSLAFASWADLTSSRVFLELVIMAINDLGEALEIALRTDSWKAAGVNVSWSSETVIKDSVSEEGPCCIGSFFCRFRRCSLRLFLAVISEFAIFLVSFVIMEILATHWESECVFNLDLCGGAGGTGAELDWAPGGAGGAAWPRGAAEPGFCVCITDSPCAGLPEVAAIDVDIKVFNQVNKCWEEISELLRLIDVSDPDFASEKSAASLWMSVMLVRGNYEVADQQIRQVTKWLLSHSLVGILTCSKRWQRAHLINLPILSLD